jgi:hypothetical protein
MKPSLVPLAIAVAAATTPAMADLYQTYDIAYSGAPYGNGASATGQLTLDLTVLGQDPTSVSGGYYGPLSPLITSLTLTVAGSTDGGNGTFTQNDFGDFLFEISGVDLTRQVVGQPGFYDFNLYSLDNAPTGAATQTLLDNGGYGVNYLLLTSLDPVTAPEPAQMVSGLLVAGLGGLGVVARRRWTRKQDIPRQRVPSQARSF